MQPAVRPNARLFGVWGVAWSCRCRGRGVHHEGQGGSGEHVYPTRDRTPPTSSWVERSEAAAPLGGSRAGPGPVGMTTGRVTSRVAEREGASDGSSSSIGFPPKPDHQSRHLTLIVVFGIKS